MTFRKGLMNPAACRAAQIQGAAVRWRDQRALWELGVKRCWRCHEIKPFDEFHIVRGKRNGRHGVCKPCRSQEAQQYRVQRAEYGKAHYLKHRDRHARQSQLNQWKRKYGLSEADIVALGVRQAWRCGICETSLSQDLMRRPHADKAIGRIDIDHNHTTGLVRGLLCHRCNTAIGLLADDPTQIGRALAWVQGNIP